MDGNQDLYIDPAAGGLARRLTDDPGRRHACPAGRPTGARVLFARCAPGTGSSARCRRRAGRRAACARTTRSSTRRTSRRTGGRSPSSRTLDGAGVGSWLLDAGDGRGARPGAPRRRTRSWATRLEPGRAAASCSPRTGGSATRSTSWTSRTGEARRISPLHRGRLRAAVQPGRPPRRLREPRPSRRARAASSSTTSPSDEERVLVDWPALNYDPAYSPDGSEIAFASNITGEYAIYRQRLADGKLLARDASVRARRAIPTTARRADLSRRGATARARAQVRRRAARCPRRRPPSAPRARPARPGRPISSTGTNTMLPGNREVLDRLVLHRLRPRSPSRSAAPRRAPSRRGPSESLLLVEADPDPGRERRARSR